jgi:S-adenosylmethionine:tRNA ribosyltransferase-isomerase
MRGSRVIAVGTSVVRALESAAEAGELAAGEGEATLVLGPRAQDEVHSLATRRLHTPRVVVSILSGFHHPGESHFDLLDIFAPPGLVLHASQLAQARGYLAHEFGDACLVLGGRNPIRGRELLGRSRC